MCVVVGGGEGEEVRVHNKYDKSYDPYDNGWTSE